MKTHFLKKYTKSDFQILEVRLTGGEKEEKDTERNVSGKERSKEEVEDRARDET